MTGRSLVGEGARHSSGPNGSVSGLPALVLVAELAGAALTGAAAAALMWTILFGSYQTNIPASASTPGETASGVMRPEARGSAAQLFRPRLQPAAGQVEMLPESRLGYALFGVRTGTRPETGSAIIEAGAGGQRSYAVGSELQDGVTLEAVHDDRVVLRRQGTREVLFLTERARARRNEPAEPLQAVTLAGVSLTPQPLTSGGEGLRIESAPPALAALGLQAGDTIATIDGEPVTAARISALGQQLAGGALPASLSLERNGERLSLQTRPMP
ncbi:type II secretion system protein N [Glycocaulis abyssi]